MHARIHVMSRGGRESRLNQYLSDVINGRWEINVVY